MCPPKRRQFISEPMGEGDPGAYVFTAGDSITGEDLPAITEPGSIDVWDATVYGGYN